MSNLACREIKIHNTARILMTMWSSTVECSPSLFVCFQVEQYLQPLVNWSLTDRLKQESSFDDPEFTPIAIFACQVIQLLIFVFFDVLLR